MPPKRKISNIVNDDEKETPQVSSVVKKRRVSSKKSAEIILEAPITPKEEETNIFADFDFTNFWLKSSYSDSHYRDTEPITNGLISSVEKELGYKLPKAYLDLCRIQNGGIIKRTKCKTGKPWPNNAAYVSGIFGLGKSKPYSLCGRFGSHFRMNEWRYPSIGVYFADTPFGGHDMLCMDYRKCGPEGEPVIVRVAQDIIKYRVHPVAKNFQSFIENLEYSQTLGIPSDDDEQPKKRKQQQAKAKGKGKAKK